MELGRSDGIGGGGVELGEAWWNWRMSDGIGGRVGELEVAWGIVGGGVGRLEEAWEDWCRL